jgi:hypothetical protein
VTPFEFPKLSPKSEVPGSESLNASEAKSRIEAKGYLEISGLEKDSCGIWRGKGIMKDGRPVNVTLDLEGNIYSTLTGFIFELSLHPRIDGSLRLAPFFITREAQRKERRVVPESEADSGQPSIGASCERFGNFDLAAKTSQFVISP